MERLRRLGRSSWLKRLLDVVGASVALLILGPLMLYLAFRVRQELGSPVLFRQVRPGLGGKPFVMYKFRTMTEERDEQGNLLPDEKRLTPFGAFLRAWSLDELPELFNVLKGDMSLVGPRPLLMQYLDRYTPEQFRRHEVKPGITGWAQVNGRNALSWEEKFKLDVWYVDNWTIWLDLKILWLTLVKVLRREGISAHGHATMPEFKGGEKG
jgi:lipopolysaccharide/colanic/teichoic acid biosynthesis glycosyltransferase